MKRRGFFKSLAGLCLAPFVPATSAMPRVHFLPNTGKMVKFRRYQALEPSTSPLVEGVVPTPNIFQVEWVTDTGSLTIVK